MKNTVKFTGIAVLTVMLILVISGCGGKKDGSGAGSSRTQSSGGDTQIAKVGSVPTLTEADYEKEMQKLVNAMAAGKITKEEMTEQIMKLTERMSGYEDDVYVEQHPTYENKGWPPASLYQNEFVFGALRQPPNTTATYQVLYNSDKEITDIEIYLDGAVDAAIQNLKQQIEAAIKEPMKPIGEGGTWFDARIRDPKRPNTLVDEDGDFVHIDDSGRLYVGTVSFYHDAGVRFHGNPIDGKDILEIYLRKVAVPGMRLKK